MEDLKWDECTVFDVASKQCRPTVPQTEVVELQAPAREVVARVAQETNALLVDFADRYCYEGVCHAVADNGDVLYRDGYHLSLEESARLESEFLKVLSDAGK